MCLVLLFDHICVHKSRPRRNWIQFVDFLLYAAAIDAEQSYDPGGRVESGTRAPGGSWTHLFYSSPSFFSLFFFPRPNEKKSVQAPPSSAAATIFRVGNSFHAAVQVRNRRGSNTTKRKNHRAVYYFLFFSLLLENNRTRVLQEGRKAFSGYIHFFFKTKIKKMCNHNK